jgi:hypothetical protein
MDLCKHDLFKFEDFNSSLKDSNISVDEYYSYLKLAKQFKTKLKYLKWYNTQDVIIMCPIIDFIINKFEENNIDMLRNISLSSCAEQVKFAMGHKSFNIKEDYSKQVKTTFKLTKDYFQRKFPTMMNKIKKQNVKLQKT